MYHKLFIYFLNIQDFMVILFTNYKKINMRTFTSTNPHWINRESEWVLIIFYFHSSFEFGVGFRSTNEKKITLFHILISFNLIICNTTGKQFRFLFVLQQDEGTKKKQNELYIYIFNSETASSLCSVTTIRATIKRPHFNILIRWEKKQLKRK